MKNFDVLILGSGINAYAMARSFHEQYGVVSSLMTEASEKITDSSSICSVQIETHLLDSGVFKRRLGEIGAGSNKEIILVGSENKYVRMIVESADFLKTWFKFNYVDERTLDTILDGEKFYKTYANLTLSFPHDHVFIDNPPTYKSFFYCSSDGVPRLQTFAQVVSDDVAINGYNQFENTEGIVLELKKFLASIGFKGMAEFNLIYDEFLHKFYVVNLQLVTPFIVLPGAEHNVAKYLVDDLIYQKRVDFEFVSDEFVLSTTASATFKQGVLNEQHLIKAMELSKNGNFTHISNYKNDEPIKRKWWFFTKKRG